MIVQTSKTKTGRDSMKSIAHFAIAGNYGCFLAAAITALRQPFGADG